MSTMIGARAPAWLRIVAALGLLWNCIGVYSIRRHPTHPAPVPRPRTAMHLQRKAQLGEVVRVRQGPCVHSLRGRRRCGASTMDNPVRSAVRERITRIVAA